MNSVMILMNSCWAGLFASGLGILLTAPARYLVPSFVCGFSGRFVRDAAMVFGLSQSWSTALAATVVVLLAFALVRRNVVSPVVLVTGVLPLGAAVAMFTAIAELMKVSALKGEALSQASVALSASIGKVFTTSLAIAVGLSVGMALVKRVMREEVREV